MKALKALGDKEAEIQDGLPIPKLRPDYMTVKTAAVGMCSIVVNDPYLTPESSKSDRLETHRLR